MIGVVGVTVAATAIVLTATGTNASAVAPCTYQLVIDQHGNVASATPDRSAVDGAMAVRAHEDEHTPTGDIAAVRAISNDATLYTISSITSTDSDGTYTITGPANVLQFDATFHTTRPGPDNGSSGPYPTATITSVTICASDISPATPTPTTSATPTATSTPAAPPTATPAATTTPTPAAATIARTSVAPGATETVSATGFTPGEKIATVLHSTPINLATITATSSGRAFLTFTVPTTLKSGTHTITLTGQKSRHTATATFTITTTTTPNTSNIANTGTKSAELIRLGGALLIAGIGLTLWSRRRTRAHA